MPDCRLVLDNISDMVSLTGSLVIGSDVVDISGAQMTQGADGWQIVIKTVAPAQQNPRLSVSVALYLDVDGRMENNAIAGPRLGADTVYGIVSGADGWKITRELMNVAENGFATASTGATHSINDDGYTLNIPYEELAKDVPAYWKVGVGVKDKTRLSVDYAPDTGMACTPALAPKGGLSEFAINAKNLWNGGLNDQVVVGAVVIAALLVIFFRWKKAKPR